MILKGLDVGSVVEAVLAWFEVHKLYITWYLLYVGYGFSYITHTGILRGKEQGPLFQSTAFLIAFRLYMFLVWWLPVYCLSAELAAAFLAYLPLYLDLSEITGSRISETIRRSAFARFVNDFFSTQLVKTVDIPLSTRPHILAIHHHGLLPFGSVAAVGTEVRGFSELFPALTNRVIVAASFCFMIPMFRDLCLMASICDCSRWCFEKWLRQGVSVAVYPGGAREATYAHPDREWLDLRRKLGFLRLSIKHDAAVVPAFSFNETNHYYQLTFDESKRRFPVFFYVQQVFHEATGVMLPVLFHIWPRLNAPVVTVVGAPIRYQRKASRTADTGVGAAEAEPTEAEVEEFMEQYIAHLKALYNQHAPSYNSKSRTLTIS